MQDDGKAADQHMAHSLALQGPTELQEVFKLGRT